jgi:phospholipase C
VFITWDENGGFYDHVVPPPACPPDDRAPCDFKFDRYGFRVPFFAISPWARENYASSYTADHTSILRFIEAWMGLPALTARDANAWPLLDMFDFDHKRMNLPAPDPPKLSEACPDPRVR